MIRKMLSPVKYDSRDRVRIIVPCNVESGIYL